MQYIKITVVSIVLAGMVSMSLSDTQNFVKKKRNGPSVTECCDGGVDVLSLSADLVVEIGKLQQHLIAISRDMIDNNKKCYLALADKEQLKTYYDKTQECKNHLEALRLQLATYTEFIERIR